MIIGFVLTALVTGGCAWWLLRSDGPQHTVQSGDTLWGIARAHGVSVDQLRTWNRLSGDHLEVGDRLQVGPGGASLDDKPVAPVADASRRRKRSQRKTIKAPAEPSGAGADGLTMPAPEPCVAFTGDPGDEGMVAPEGLTVAQARTALNGVLSDALSCMPDPDVDRIDLVFELVVGCDGVVSRVATLDSGAGSARYAACVAAVLSYADFPAHDLPDGDTITYPVTVEW